MKTFALILLALLTMLLAGCHAYEPADEEHAAYLVPQCDANAPAHWTAYVSDHVSLTQVAQAFQERGWHNITAEYDWHNSVSADCALAV